MEQNNLLIAKPRARPQKRKNTSFPQSDAAQRAAQSQAGAPVMRQNKGRTDSYCNHPGCNARATHAPSVCLFPFRCKKHADLNTMITKKWRACRGTDADGNELGCPKMVTYGRPGDPFPTRCSEHQTDDDEMFHMYAKRCEHAECVALGHKALIACFGHDGGNPTRCFSHAGPGMVNITSKKCAGKLEDGKPCTKQPCFGVDGTKIGVYCGDHKHLLPGAVNIRDRTCNFPGCHTQPFFGHPEDERATRCSSHKTEGMVNIRETRACQHVLQDGHICGERPHYGFPGDARPSRCSAHAVDEMEQLYKNYCTEDGCKNGASFGLCAADGKVSATKCSAHQTPDMVSSDKRICQWIDEETGEKCTTTASFGSEETRKRVRCATHAEEGMMNLANLALVCRGGVQNDECSTIAIFGHEGQKRTACKQHIEPGMIDLAHPLCDFPECVFFPSFGFVVQVRATRCAKHSETGMINILDPRCLTPLCEKFVTKKYDGYCRYCFSNMHPTDERLKYYKLKESTIVNMLKAWISEHFPDIANDPTRVQFDKILGGCSNRRPDVFIEMFTHVIIIEIDENQHASYNTTCEQVRAAQLYDDVAGRKIVFLRFNPDGYTDSEGRPVLGCFGPDGPSGMVVIKSKRGYDGKTGQERLDYRMGALFEQLQVYMTTVPDDIVVKHLFFDEL
jgi:hypothetical protein